MTTPLVSFCIPTYNRSRYLQSLLLSLTDQLANFPYAFEVFISDNASDDGTPDIVADFVDQLPIRFVRHEENRGGRANYQYMMAQAKGRYLIYIADDDCILGERVAEVVSMMEANPDVGIAYAPWKLLDLVNDQDQGQFYTQDRDILVSQGDQRLLLDTLLRYQIFPEIYICRRELVQAVMPRIHEQAYYAFVHAAEFVQHAQVMFLKDPYYVSVTQYFADHQRVQGGTEEVEVAWDRYRGGLEHVLGRALPQVTPSERVGFGLRIQDMIAQRIAVAVRLRVANERDAIETYYLAYRLKAMAAEHLLDVQLPVLRMIAVLGFLLTDPELNRGRAALLCVGAFSASTRAYIERKTHLPVTFVATMQDVTPLSAPTLVFTTTDGTRADLPADSDILFVTERELLSKFVG